MGICLNNSNVRGAPFEDVMEEMNLETGNDHRRSRRRYNTTWEEGSSAAVVL